MQGQNGRGATPLYLYSADVEAGWGSSAAETRGKRMPELGLAREELLRHAPERASAITVGVFDGVHLGHQHLIGKLRQRAEERGLAAAVVTLHPAPIQVLRPQVRIAYLTSLEE